MNVCLGRREGKRRKGGWRGLYASWCRVYVDNFGILLACRACGGFLPFGHFFLFWRLSCAGDVVLHCSGLAGWLGRPCAWCELLTIVRFVMIVLVFVFWFVCPAGSAAWWETDILLNGISLLVLPACIVVACGSVQLVRMILVGAKDSRSVVSVCVPLAVLIAFCMALVRRLMDQTTSLAFSSPFYLFVYVLYLFSAVSCLCRSDDVIGRCQRHQRSRGDAGSRRYCRRYWSWPRSFGRWGMRGTVHVGARHRGGMRRKGVWGGVA